MTLTVILLLLAVVGVLVLVDAPAVSFLKFRRRRQPPPANLVSPGSRRQTVRDETKRENEMSLFNSLIRTLSGKKPDAAATPPPAGPAIPAPAVDPVAVDWEDDRIPTQAKDRVRRILACLHEVETELGRQQVPGFSRVDIEQMRQQHLPKLVLSYINIPAAHRGEIFRKTGKSASFILNESLDQMQGKIDDIMRNLAQHDLDAFTNNTRFIGQRYSDEENPFG
jgi:hypothetical protein